MKELPIYNLQFPAFVHTLDIAGYTFKRVKDYPAAFGGLQHIIEATGGEFPIKLNTGTHQLTARLEMPEEEKPCILNWKPESKFTRLQDVLLFLSLFIGRNIFELNPGEEHLPLKPDPRGHFWGGQFRLSARSNAKWANIKTGEIRTDEDMHGVPVFDWRRFDIGLEETINEILDRITSEEWKNEYDTGYFIFTFRQAMQQSYVEPAFLLCWAIWEHLFTLHNRKWLDDSALEQTNGDRKIAFILNRYFGKIIDDFARKNIKRLVKARNRLIHFGAMSEEIDTEEMQMFIRLTEQIVSLTLGLRLSNVLNSLDSLESFLRKS